MGKKLTPADWDAILLNRAYGMNNQKSALALETSTTSVSATLQAFDAVRDEDWTKCCNLIVSYDMGLEVYQWAAQKQGKTIPPIIAQSYEKWKEDRRKKNLEAVKAKEEAAKPAAQMGGTDTEIVLKELLKAQRKTNELLESLLDVVIPKYVGDLKDNVNLNCDVINQTVKGCEDRLEAVKLGLRKKGL